MGLISIKDISRQHHLTYQTVNYYTTIGLLKVKERRGNKRMYDEDDAEKRLRWITKLKNQGYPLGLIIRKLNGRKGAGE